jgi:hypothetical protein
VLHSEQNTDFSIVSVQGVVALGGHFAKLCLKMNQTTLGVGHFMTVSGDFFANYISNFHKTEGLMVILRCLTYLNLN